MKLLDSSKVNYSKAKNTFLQKEKTNIDEERTEQINNNMEGK